jgi:tetratricopeptide (TPR) repeat protein
MLRFIFTATWLVILVLLGFHQPVVDTPTSMWEPYFERIRTNSTASLAELEGPILEAMDRAKERADKDGVLENTVLLMLVYNNQAKFSRTFELFSEMIADDPDVLNGNSFNHKAFQYVGYHSNSRVNKKQDLVYLQKVAGTFGKETAQQRLFQALSFDLLGRTLYDQNQYAEATIYLLRANEIIKEDGLKGFLGGNYTMLGIVQDALEDYRKAMVYYEMSNDVIATLHKPLYGSMAVNAYNIGIIHLDRFGDALKGLPYFELALKYDQLDGGDESPYLADDYRMLSRVYQRLYDYEKANQYIERAIEHYNAFSYPENPSLATAYLNLASIQAVRRQFGNALVSVDRAFGIYRENERKYAYDIRRWLVVAYNTRGNIALDMGNLGMAIEAFQNAVTISQDLDRTIYLMDAYRGLIKAYIKQGDPILAHTIFEKWSAIVTEKLPDARLFAFERRIINLELDHERTDFRVDAKLLDNLINELRSESGMFDLYTRSLRLKTLVIFDQVENYGNEQVIAHIEELMEGLVRAFNEQSGIRNKADYTASIKPTILDAVRLCSNRHMATDDSRYLGLAFKLMDISKSASLTDGLNLYKDKISKDIPAKLREQEDVLETSRSALLIKINRLSEMNDSDSKILLKAYAEYESVGRQLDSLYSILRVSYPNYVALRQIDTQVDITETMQGLRPDETLVAYLSDSTEAFAFVLTKHSKKLHVLDGFDQYYESLRQFRHDLINRSEPLAREVVDRFLPVDVNSLTRLVIIPDGILSGIPFEALPVGERLLVEQASISYRSGFRTPMLANRRGWDWRGFAPEYTERPLPYNRAEVERISKITGGLFFSASEASKEHFLAHAPEASIIHLAAHGNIDNDNPIFSSISFGDDNTDELTAVEIYGLRLAGSLAVLSACNTGLTYETSGDGWLSLSRAFSFAGMQSTLMSLWEVPDRETAVIMELFYTHLHNGLPKDEALRLAKVTYLNQTTDPALKHPYYWAGFVLSGDTSAYSRSTSLWFWLLPVVFAVFVYGWHRFKSMQPSTIGV